MPVEKELADVHNMHSKKEEKPQKTTKKILLSVFQIETTIIVQTLWGWSYTGGHSCFPWCGKEWFQETNMTGPISANLWLDFFRKPILQSASASALSRAKESQGICTSHQPWRTKHDFGQDFRQTNFRTALMNSLLYQVGGRVWHQTGSLSWKAHSSLP